MTFASPAYLINRKSVVGEENDWVKMWDPPKESPVTPELLTPTNPVPAFMAATLPGVTNVIPNTVRLNLMHGRDLDMWDGKKIKFFLFDNPDLPLTAGGSFPGPTIRIPRGVIFHGYTEGGGPPPHTIHWHGIEPTPINDGVGHCSMEIGSYTYQWQPNFIGSYFYHCHRNTMQHFEFGLYGFLIIEPPNAYNANPTPGGSPPAPGGPGGYPRRIQANLTKFPGLFPGFNNNPLDFVLPGGDLDPHAMTVPYDAEALWVMDDRSSQWSDFMKDPRATFPQHGTQPGVNDQFFSGDFHDFNPDYFFATGVNFAGPLGSTTSLAHNLVVPAELNSGVTGMQISVNAQRNHTILVRCLNGAYVSIRVTFPVDALIIAMDGRAFGVPPFAAYSEPFLLKAGTPFELSTARRIDALIRSATTVNSFASVEYFNVAGGGPLFTGRIPIVIN